MKDEKAQGIRRRKKCVCQKLGEKVIVLEAVKRKRQKSEQSRGNQILK